MTIETRAEAVKTAADRLTAIEAWSRRTSIATMVAASFLGVMMMVTLYVGYDYICLKMGMAAAARKMEAGFTKNVAKLNHTVAAATSKGQR